MPLTLYKRGKIWHYRGTVAGRRLRGSTRTTKKAAAERFVSDLEDKQWKGHFDGPAAVLTFAQAAILYRQAQKPTRFLEKIENYWQDTLVSDIKAGHVHKAAIALYPKASAATRNRQVIAPTQAIINFAAEMELCPHLKVKRFPVVSKKKTPATWGWVQDFMAHANAHLGALCCFMFLTGARVGEAVEVLWRDVDLSSATVLIRETKIGSERVAHMPPALVAAIANIESNRNPEEKVFKYSSRDTVKPQWNKVLRRGAMKKHKPLSFHSCRHGFATTLLHKGVDPITVAKLGGWKSPQHVFQTYGHAKEDKRLANLLTDTSETRDNDERELKEINQNVR
ncbi:tyrosine-type recombinase/integrase [Shinella pollutisoli]|uniref:Tyrosine-type recombinase/integrase n=1 Tax=Shinella pollutisoli TaxID=2250594 RepID=A0ABV7DD52_9HYPH|nr:site-specific integrase [Shinella pollutisoli]